MANVNEERSGSIIPVSVLSLAISSHRAIPIIITSPFERINILVSEFLLLFERTYNIFRYIGKYQVLESSGHPMIRFLTTRISIINQNTPFKLFL
jgi:hypothetical protein